MDWPALLLGAVEFSGGEIAGIVTTVLGVLGGAITAVWKYWTKREGDKRKAWEKVVADKDALIAQKDQRIEELSKELSRKSDQHADKIEELMTLVVTKVESWSAKLEQVLDRSLKVQASFTAEVKEFTGLLLEMKQTRERSREDQ